MKLSRLKVFTVTSLSTAFLVALVIILIVVTPLKEYIPGYPKKEYRQMLIRNSILVDSLENELQNKDIFFQNIKTIIEGGVPEDNYQNADTGTQPGDIVFQQYNHDSVFQDKILEEQLNLSLNANNSQNTDLSKIHFFIPVKGMVTNTFKSSSDHYGVDLVSTANSLILSVLDGTIIFAGWTLQTGYVIYIQHENNLISVYKHNAELLKNIGDKVNAGEAIAIIGNSGELSTGPHLHFELWYDGVALDPELYIDL
ncbi:MAG: M23 family metallopeptidase [Mariniphaga sp.]|nr:M23 family metallopeptidase [Mariniphaga sp.]